MKIVHVCGWYFPDPDGGSETYVTALASRLSAAGHQIAVAAPDPVGNAERTYRHEGFAVYRYPVPSRPTREESDHRVVARGAERLHAWFRQTRPDVVHFHTFATGAGPHELREARAAGARVFATAHTGSVGFLCRRGTLMRWGHTRCDGAVTPSTCAACELQHRGVPRPAADILGRVPASLSRLLARLPGTTGAVFVSPAAFGRVW